MPEAKFAQNSFKSALALRDAVQNSEVDLDDIVAACRHQIDEMESGIGAWETLDWNTVNRQVADIRSIADWRHLPLAGIPLAVKDIFDTFDFPTAYGSPIYTSHRPVIDAAAVARLRTAGAIIIGKSVSTEFAYWQAGKTRNPLDPLRTPGGSSSGSAAAVAARMVPLAIGSQTAASTIRPASYCGIVGFKPTHGLISLAGVKALSNSLDTVGVFAHSVDDARLIAGVLAGRLEALRSSPQDAPYRFRLAISEEWHRAETAILDNTRNAAKVIKAAGAAVEEIQCPPPFHGLTDVQAVILAVEAARELAFERMAHAGDLSQSLMDLFAFADSITADAYDDACRMRDQCRNTLDTLFDSADFLLAPSTLNEAPLYENGTGSPDMSRAWTMLGLPSITIPNGTRPNCMPLGLQIAARPYQDRLLLDAAAWIETIDISNHLV